MSKPWALKDLMTAVEAGHVVDSDKLLAPGRRSISNARGRKSAPMPVAEACSDTSFEFSAAVSYSSASPASMVFSDGQLRAHQFPAVQSPSAARGTAGSSQAASPARQRSASTGSSGAREAGVTRTGSKKRVSFAADGAAKAAAAGGGGQGKKSGGLLGCMGSACGSSRNEVVEPANRKVVAV